MRFGPYELDLARFELNRRGMPVRVQPKVLDLLVYLIRNRERVVPKQELLESLWKGVVVSEDALTHAVKEARRVVRDDGSRQAVIRTVRGRGYRFVAEVDEEQPGVGAATEPFVGRQVVLQILGQEFAAVRAGEGRAVFLTGEPGIGKSRTAVEFARSLGSDARLLLGRGAEGMGAPAHWPWTQIVRSALGRGLIEGRRLRDESAAVLVQSLPDLRADLGGSRALAEPVSLPDEQARFRLWDEVARLLHGIAKSQPLVLVLDDLQWADESSLRLLDFMVRESGDQPILIIGTYREAELSRDPARAQLLGAVARNPGAHSVLLEGLTRSDVASLFEAVTGQAASETLAASLHDRTGGNPFFVTQVVRLWEAAGRASDELHREGPIPQGVREVINRHLDVLPETARDLMCRAAVIGREFELDVLAHVSGTSVDSALETLDAGLEARVVRPVGESWTRFEFAHALIPETLYAAMSAPRRLRLHARVAGALEALRGHDPGRVSEIAHHYALAAPLGYLEAAVRYCTRAADLAIRQLAYEEAVRHHERALELLAGVSGDDPRRLEQQLALGESQARVGAVAAARQTLLRAAALARERGDAEALARAALGIDWEIVRQGSVGTDAVRLALLGEALGAVGAKETSLRVRLLAALDEALYFEDDADQGPSLSWEAVAMARRLDDPEALVFALNRRHLILRRPECLDERLEVSTELVRLARRRRDPALIFDAHGSQLHDALEHGDLQLVDEALETFERLAREHKLPKYLWYADLYCAMRDLLAGRFPRAEERIARAHGIGSRVQRDLARLWHAVQMQALRVDQGRAAEFLPELRAVSELYPLDAMRLNLALVEAMTGFTGPGRQALDHAVRDGVGGIRRDISWILSLAGLAQLAELLEHRQGAAAVYRELLPFAQQHIVGGTAIVYRGSVAHDLGRLAAVLGRWDEADHHFETALARERRMAARPFEAAVLCSWARMLLARGAGADRDEAQRRLTEARCLARELGAQRVEREADALEQQARTRPDHRSAREE